MSPRENRAQFICNMIQNLYDTPHSSEVMIFNTWMTHVPSHLGSKITLDSAMAAFTIHLLGKTANDDRLIQESRSIYGQSLAALQNALNHPMEWKSTETLGSAMILCMFEVCAFRGQSARFCPTFSCLHVPLAIRRHCRQRQLDEACCWCFLADPAARPGSAQGTL